MQRKLEFVDLMGQPGLRIIGRRILHLSSTNSTMEVARSQAELGAADGTVVITDQQSTGRGRHGREWYSEPGQDLLLSIVLRPTEEISSMPMMLAAVAVVRTVESFIASDVSIKWPNDVLINNRKVCGVLAESFHTNKGNAYVLGIGLNVNSTPSHNSKLGSRGISLRECTHKALERTTVLSVLLHQLDDLYCLPDCNATIYNFWLSKLSIVGSQVGVALGRPPGKSGTVRGVVEQVDMEGRLVVRDRRGYLHHLSEGDVSLKSEHKLGSI